MPLFFGLAHLHHLHELVVHQRERLRDAAMLVPPPAHTRPLLPDRITLHPNCKPLPPEDLVLPPIHSGPLPSWLVLRSLGPHPPGQRTHQISITT